MTEELTVPHKDALDTSPEWYNSWDPTLQHCEPFGIAPGVTLTQTGALIRDDVLLEDWAQALGVCQALGNATMWALGDLLLYAHEHTQWGEKYSQFLDLTGKSYSTLTKATYVARHYPHEERVTGLSWSHHMEAASIKDKDQRHQLLSQAKEEGWTREQVHDHRMGTDKQKEIPQTQMCPVCGHRW